MEKFIIIRGTANSGKTTTAGLVFEKLRATADFSKVFDYSLEERENLEYDANGNLYDFIGILILNGKVVIIISRGDVAKDLKILLDKLCKLPNIRKVSSNQAENIDVIVCCARSVNKSNSTISMLYDRISLKDRFEFWTDWSQNKEDMISIKHNVVLNIISKIRSLI